MGFSSIVPSKAPPAALVAYGLGCCPKIGGCRFLAPVPLGCFPKIEVPPTSIKPLFCGCGNYRLATGSQIVGLRDWTTPSQARNPLLYGLAKTNRMAKRPAYFLSMTSEGLFARLHIGRRRSWGGCHRLKSAVQKVAWKVQRLGQPEQHRGALDVIIDIAPVGTLDMRSPRIGLTPFASKSCWLGPSCIISSALMSG